MPSASNPGLYANCRKKPYLSAAHAPVVGGSYGMFRNFPNDASYAQAVISLEATDIDELLAQTALAEATYDSATIDCWDATTLINSSPLALSTSDYTDTYQGNASAPLVAAWLTSTVGNWSYYGEQVAGPATVANGATLSGSVLATVDDDGGSNLNLNGFTVVDGGSFDTWNVTISHAGSTVWSGSTIGVSFNDASPQRNTGLSIAVSGYALSKLTITATNATGSSKSNVKLYLYGGRFGVVNASNPVYLVAGLHTHLFDAPGITLGDLYRTLTCRTAGSGQSKVGWSFGGLTAHRTNVSTGTHHCELDELCNPWID